MWKNALILLCILTGSRYLQAQDTLPFSIGARGQYGFLIAHHHSMAHLVTRHIPSAELFAEFGVSGKKPWHHQYRRPSYGFSFYTGQVNPELTGSAFALLTYLNLHIVERQRFEWNFRMGIGPGYIHKIFSPETNNRNNAIGSHFNAAILMSSGLRWKGNTFDWGAGLSFLHFSNGAFKTPNLGINLPSLYADLRYHIRRNPVRRLPEGTPSFKKHWYFSALLSGGLKEILPSGGQKYPVTDLSVFATRQYSPRSGISFGADVFYNSSLPVLQKNATGEVYPDLSFVQVGVHAGYEMGLDHLKILFQTGGYLHSRYKTDGSIYQRVGLRYYFPSNLIVHLSLKTHLAKADYAEIGIGYRFKSRSHEKQ